VGEIYAAVRQEQHRYCHGAATAIIEVNQTKRERILDRIFTGKHQVVARLAERGVRDFAYRKFLTVRAEDLSGRLALADVENVILRLFALAGGALPLANFSTRDDLFLEVPLGRAVVEKFGTRIVAAFRPLSNARFLRRLQIAMNVLAAWKGGSLRRNGEGLRGFVPMRTRAGAEQFMPMAVKICLNETGAMQEVLGVASELYRQTPSRGPGRIFTKLPGQGVNNDKTSLDESRAIARLQSLCC